MKKKSSGIMEDSGKSDDLLKAFVDRSKKSQQERDKKKI